MLVLILVMCVYALRVSILAVSLELNHYAVHAHRAQVHAKDDLLARLKCLRIYAIDKNLCIKAIYDGQPDAAKALVLEVFDAVCARAPGRRKRRANEVNAVAVIR